jgi:molybdopterin-guanine dinucleotide biosynthesis protein A
MLAGVVLAGGRSTRMGQDKSQLTLADNHTNLLALSQKLMASLVNENVWVSGEQHPYGLPDLFVGYGPMSGIYSALHHLTHEQPSIDEVIFVPVDMPLLTLKDLEPLLEEGRRHNTLVCYENHMFPLYVPLSGINSAGLLEYLHLQLSASKHSEQQGKNRNLSIRSVLTKFNGKQVITKDDASLVNINTPEQWQQYKAAIKTDKH